MALGIKSFQNREGEKWVFFTAFKSQVMSNEDDFDLNLDDVGYILYFMVCIC